MTVESVLAVYAANSDALARRYEQVAAADHFAAVADLFPPPPARVADIGAGSGRDAGWFAEAGYQVLAVEPVAQMREAAARRHPAPSIRGLGDHLPDLPATRAAGRFDLVTLSAVWHHMPPDDRPVAMAALAGLLEGGGVLAMSLRLGPVMPDRGVHDADEAGTTALAEGAGLRVIRRVEVAAQQAENIAGGISWVWLVLTPVRG